MPASSQRSQEEEGESKFENGYGNWIKRKFKHEWL